MSSTPPAVRSVGDSNQLGPTTAAGANCAGTTAGGIALTLDGPLLDPAAGTNGTVYVFIGNDGTAANRQQRCLPVRARLCCSTTCGNKITLGVGSTTGVPVYSGTFDNIYFTSAPPARPGISTPAEMRAVTRRFTGTDRQQRNERRERRATPLSTANTTCSPVTEFLNGAIDRAFLSVAGVRQYQCEHGCPAGGGGCVMSFNITAAGRRQRQPRRKAGEPGGTSGIVVDNSSAHGRRLAGLFLDPRDRLECDPGITIRAELNRWRYLQAATDNSTA